MFCIPSKQRRISYLAHCFDLGNCIGIAERISALKELAEVA